MAKAVKWAKSFTVLKWAILVCLALVALSNIFYLAISSSWQTAPLQKLTRATIGKAVSYDEESTVHAYGEENALAQATMLCRDAESSCADMARQGMCRSSTAFAMQTCKKSCQLCGPLATTISDQVLLQLATVVKLSCQDEAQDDLGSCEMRAAAGHCASQPESMLTACKATCGFCTRKSLHGGSTCSDELDFCPYLANQLKLCGSEQHWWTQTQCMHSCHHCTDVAELPGAVPMLGFNSEGQLSQAAYVRYIAPTCKDSDPACEAMASSDACKTNPGFMHKTCPKSCKSCDPTYMFLPRPLSQVLLNNGVLMPVIGFGTAGLGDDTQEAVHEALAAGYKHIDSAQAREWYRENLVGAAIRASRVKRAELFLTTKIHPKNVGYTKTMEVFSKSQKELQTDYIDLLLLHYPRCWVGLEGCTHADVARDAGGNLWEESWKAMEELYKNGQVRAIGVSNFNVQDMALLLQVATVRPQVLQVHLDPLNQNHELLTLCREQGIQLVAYSSLGTQEPLGPKHQNQVLSNSIIKEVAGEVGKTPAQVVLRWVLQQGAVVLPRSSNAQHMRENLDLFGFELDKLQVEKVAKMLKQ